MRHFGFALMIAALVSACGSNAASPLRPSATTPTALSSLTGTWAGSSADATGSAQMTWTVTENGTGVNGSMNLSNTGRGMMGAGSMQGTVSGQTVTFHMDVPTGGFTGTMSSCTMTADGQGTVSADGHTMTGTYSGTLSGMMSGGMMNQSCGGSMANGQFTLTR